MADPLDTNQLAKNPLTTTDPIATDHVLIVIQHVPAPSPPQSPPPSLSPPSLPPPSPPPSLPPPVRKAASEVLQLSLQIKHELSQIERRVLDEEARGWQSLLTSAANLAL